MESLRKVFVSSDEARLRSGWRVLAQFWIMFALIPIVGALFFGLSSLTPILAFFGDEIFISVVVYSLSVYIARRWLDRRSLRSLGLEWNQSAVRDVLVGIIIAGACMALIFAAELSLGWLELRGLADLNQTTIMDISYWGFAFILVGWGEELLSRGYMLQNLAEGAGLNWAVFISSAIFSLLHILNPGASWTSILGILAAGYFLAYGDVRTRQLWLPIGLHIGWNFFEGPVFGFPVSGLETEKLMLHDVSGPPLFTGGAFGPEAGLIVLPAIFVGAVLIYLYTHQRTAPSKAKP